MQKRFDVLSALEQGWDGDDAEKMNPLVLRIAKRVLQQLLIENVPEPELGAVEDGRLDIYWEMTESLFCTLGEHKLRVQGSQKRPLQDIPLEGDEDAKVKSLVEILHTLLDI